MKGLYRGFCRNENGTETIVLNGEKIKGEWVQGFYTLYANNRGLHPCILTGTEEGCVIPKFVVAETVCEAVRGLTDRNGKQVFEGDKVKWCSIEGTIVFELHRFYVKGNILWDFGHDDIIEVIGTIFDEQFAEGV